MTIVKVACPDCNKLVRRGGLARHQYATGCRVLDDDEFIDIDETLCTDPPTGGFDNDEYDDLSWMGMTSDPMPMLDSETREVSSPRPLEQLDPIHRTYTVPYPGAGTFFGLPSYLLLFPILVLTA
jgi:hypothetical protein